MIAADASTPMNQTIVITGCRSGFGYDLALTPARRGDGVHATMRDPGGRNAEVARALRDLAQAESLDLKVLDPVRRRVPRQQVGARPTALLRAGSRWARR